MAEVTSCSIGNLGFCTGYLTKLPFCYITVFLKELQRDSSEEKRDKKKDRPTLATTKKTSSYKAHVGHEDKTPFTLTQWATWRQMFTVCWMTPCQLLGRPWRLSSKKGYANSSVTKTETTLRTWQFFCAEELRYVPEDKWLYITLSCWGQKFITRVQLCIWRDTKARHWGS